MHRALASCDADRMASPRLLIGRCSAPGHWYVVTTVTHARNPLFLGQDAANAVIQEMQRCHAEGWLRSTAWVVMPDHLHWMFALGAQQRLSRCVQAMKSRSARMISAPAPVWQPGYYDHRIHDERDLCRQAEYLLANPVRLGLTQRIGEYPYAWSQWHTHAP